MSRIQKRRRITTVGRAAIIRSQKRDEIFRMYHVLKGYAEAKPDIAILDNIFEFRMFANPKSKDWLRFCDDFVSSSHSKMELYFNSVIKEINEYVEEQHSEAM